MSLRIFQPDQSPQPGQSPTVQDVVDWFLSRKTSTNKTALTEIRRILRLFIAKFGPVSVEKMTGADLVEFVEGFPDVRKLNTVARWYRTIKQPFNVSERMGITKFNPFKMVAIPKGDRGRDLSPSEFRALLRLTTPIFRRVLIFLRYSGARPGELRELLWTHIVWTQTGATIVKKLHKTSATQATPKPRKIYLPAPLVKLLLWLKKRSKSEFVFVNKFGGPWQIGTLCTRLRKLRQKAQFGPDVKLYGCRHMFATQCVLTGIDPATLQQLMGHANIATTQIYIHLAGQDEHLADAVEKAFRGRKDRSPSPEN